MSDPSPPENLPPAAPGRTRRIFIGDVQGCREELERLLEALRFDPASDDLEPVGDLVNRGPDSLGALRLLSSLGAGGVLGNHDLALLATAAGERRLKPTDTLRDVLEAADREELLAWLRARPFVRSFDRVVMVHGGFDPTWSDPVERLEREDPRHPGPDASYAVSVRSCDARGRRPEVEAHPPRPPFAPWHTRFDRSRVGDRTVVFGHWAAQGLLVCEGFRGLDTGCVWGGSLTAWIEEEDRLVQVPAARAYAPIRASGGS